MPEKSRFSILDHILNALSRNKRNLWHKPVEISPGYFAFTTEYDRVVEGSALDTVLGKANRDAEDAFRSSLSGFRNSVALLRSAKKARLATLRKNIQESLEHRNAVATVLIDHSGSMRGDGIQLAAVLAALVGQCLSDAGFRVEVLGFTTSSWQGGKSRQHWLELEKLPFPGRLNDLLHVIHRPFDRLERWSDDDVKTVLTPNLLKENVDGEALIWAESRLLAIDATDRFMFVISDGVPVDDSTIDANTHSDGTFPLLGGHLKEQISRIVREGQIHLFAAGINFRVDQFYDSSTVLTSIHDVCSAASAMSAFVVQRLSGAAHKSQKSKQLTTD
jgi:cobaltochelatase CobT